MAWKNGDTERRNGHELSDLREKIARLEERLSASDKALLLSEHTLEMYKISNNEWRDENRDQRETMVTRKEHEFVVADIRELRDATGSYVTRKEFDGSMAFQNKLIGGLVLISILIPILLRFYK